MSTSPACGEYKFPLESKISNRPKVNYGFSTSFEAPSEPLDLSGMNQLIPDTSSTSVTSQECDYFGMSFSLPVLQTKSNSTFISPRKPSLRHGTESISSLGSVSTVVSNHLNSFISQEFTQSTDTLVDDRLDDKLKPVAHSKNVLLLSLNLPRRGTQNYYSRSANSHRTDYDSLFSRSDAPTKPPHSSTGTHFELANKFSQHSEETNIFSSPNQIRAGSVPLLRKQVTAPSFPPIHEMSFLSNIKVEQVRRTSYVPPQANFRESIISLSPSITYMSPNEVANLVIGAKIDPQTHLRSVLPIDIRPLTDYVKSHLTGAINVCLPLTLLKRQNFNLKKCINSLPAYETLIFQNHLHHNCENKANDIVNDNILGGKFGLPTIIVYDNVNNSSNLLFMCKKLLDYSCWCADAAPSIILVDGTFELLALQHPDALTSGNADMIDLNLLRIKAENQGCLDDVSSIPSSPCVPRTVRSQSTSGISTLVLNSSSNSSTAVSNFFLPQNLPSKLFKIRHNEEVFNTSMAPCAEDDLSAINVDSANCVLLPKWLALSIQDKCKIRADFNILEKREKDRLNRAFSSGKNSIIEETGECVPLISSGLDYGHKNRYKDIFLFEHSRVKLLDNSGALSEEPDLNYINASYLNTNESLQIFGGLRGTSERTSKESNFLVTQGPMSQTTGDFWRCVVEQKSLVIVSLSAQYENGVEKCYPYWNPGLYYSGSHRVQVVVEKMEKMESYICRQFAVSIDDDSPHRVTQLHQENWKDLSADVGIDDVLRLVAMKQSILRKASSLPQNPTVVHCSAGCGRTGVFCVVDHLINMIEDNGSSEFSRDPIFEVVDAFRRLRVLMVQTVRQYGLLYRIMVGYVLGQKKCEKYLPHEA